MSQHGIAIDHALDQQVPGAFKAVQDGHRPHDVDLVVVDPEGRETGGCLSTGYAEDQERTALLDAAQAVFDGGHAPVASITTSQPRGSSSSSAGGGDAVGREPPGEVEAARVDVHHVNRLPAGLGCQLSEHQPHGAGPVDEVAAGEPEVDLIEAVHGAGERLDQRPPPARQFVGQRIGVLRGHGDILGAGSEGSGHAESIEVLAQVVATQLAEIAPATEQGGVDGDEVPDPYVAYVGPDRRGLPAELVARNDRVASWGEVAFEHVDVGAADAAGLYLDDDLARTRGRVVDSLDADPVWLFDQQLLSLDRLPSSVHGSAASAGHSSATSFPWSAALAALRARLDRHTVVRLQTSSTSSSSKQMVRSAFESIMTSPSPAGLGVAS